MGEAYGSCAEGQAVLGTRQKKIQHKSICVTLNEPPDADPHVRWCERERLAAAPYSIFKERLILWVSLQIFTTETMEVTEYSESSSGMFFLHAVQYTKICLVNVEAICNY